MSIPPLQQTALTGLRDAMVRMEQDAVTIARAGAGPDAARKVTPALISQRINAYHAEANLRSLQVAGEVLGSLLDVRA